MRVSRLRTGIILIGIGLILLGNTLGYLDWSVWGSLIRLWPVLLIAIGIELIFRRTSVSALAYISPLLLILCFVYVIYTGDSFASNNYNSEVRSSQFVVTRQDIGEIDTLEINLNLSLGHFDITKSMGDIFNGNFEYYNSEPRFSFKNDDGRGIIKVRYNKTSRVIRHYRQRADSEIEFSDEYPVKMNISAGVTGIDMDFRDVNITDLDIDSGVSELTVRFGEKAEHINAEFDIGVSQLTVYIPEGTAVRLKKDTGLAMIAYKKLGLNKTGKNRYESPGFDQAPRTISIDIEAGVSDIKLKYYNTKLVEI